MMKTSRLVIECSLLVGLLAYTQVSMPRIAGATADRDDFGRVSFREMPVELLIRDTFRDSAQVTTLIGTDGDRSYILFDRSGFSGKQLSGQTANSWLKAEISAPFEFRMLIQGRKRCSP
jgi:hypothetical protein